MEILVPESFTDPEDGFGLQQAVLEEVAAGERGPTALVWSSSRYVGATRPETRLPGFAEGLRLAGELGFPVLIRNSGGGAVAANRASLSFSLTFPVRDLRHGLYERYGTGAEVVVSALRRLGVEAEAGEVEREFCPGAYSVRSGGPWGIKVAGLAQRVTRRAARMEALILVSGTGGVRLALERFYGALGLPFRPGGVGDLTGTGGPVEVGQVAAALSAELRGRYGGQGVPLGDETLRKAISYRGRWRAGVRGLR